MSMVIRTNTLNALRACTALTFVSVFAAGAAAQDSVGIEEITVTARQRSESIQSVPDTITVFNAETIENARIRRVDDFMSKVPNVEFLKTQSVGNFQMSIRGISMVGLGEAPVVMVVDGVTLPYPNGFNTPMFEIESIEVLKGPQGALYGQNAIGGALVVTTRAPSDELEGRVTVGLGKGDQHQAMGSISGPLVDGKVLARLSAYHNSFDGDYRYATGNRNRQNFLRDNMGRLSLKFLASDTFTADVNAVYGTTFDGGGTLVPVTTSANSGIPRVTTAQLNSLLVLGQPNQDLESRTDRNVLTGSLRMEWNAGFATITSVTAGVKVNEGNYQDADVTYIPFVGGVQDQFVKAFSQELRVTSPSDQPFRWIVTGFLQRTNRDQVQDIRANLTLITTGNINPAAQVRVPASVLTRSQNLDSNGIAAQVNYDIMPNLELTLAGRYDHDPRDQLTVSTAPAVPNVYLKRTFNKFQPKASLSYKPTDEQTYYFTFAEGFRAGGFNLTGANLATQPVYDPEQTTTFEAGAKFSLLDRRLRLNIAGYTTKYENQQLTLTQVSTGGALTQGVFTVKSNRVKGLEFESQARLTPELEFGLNGGLQDGKIKEFGNSLSGGNFNPTAYVGNKVPLQANYTLSTYLQYTHALSDAAEIFLRGDLSRKGRMYFYADNRIARDPFTLVNVKAGVRAGEWEFNVYGSNIFNKSYYYSYFDNTFVSAPGGFNFAFLGEKSRYGAELTYRF